MYGIQRDYTPPAVFNWSSGIQQKLGFGTTLGVAYVGDAPRHDTQMRDLNATSYRSIYTTLIGNRPLPANFLRPIVRYSSIANMELPATPKPDTDASKPIRCACRSVGATRCLAVDT